MDGYVLQEIWRVNNMNCITQILEKKGKSDFILVPYYPERQKGIAVEGGGKHRGYEWIVTFVDNGFRCGYVAISKE